MGAFPYQQTARQGVAPDKMFRGQTDSNGEPIWDDVDNESYVVPPTGEYHLKLIGFSETFDDEIPVKYQKTGGPTTSKKTSVELEIASGRGQGRRFLWNFISFSLGMGKNPSHLGRVYRAGVLNGGEPPRGQQLLFDDLIGCEFQAFVQASDMVDEEGKPAYATLAKETIRPQNVAGKDYDPFDERVA